MILLVWIVRCPFFGVEVVIGMESKSEGVVTVEVEVEIEGVVVD